MLRVFDLLLDDPRVPIALDKGVPRALSTRVGLYFGVVQLFFALSWVIYVIYLPKLAAQAGIARGVVPWILVLDQLIFALCDWAAGLAADRVATVVGRLGRIVAGVTALSALAFLLLPLVTGFGGAALLALTIIWSITSAALRAPALTLLGRYTPSDQQPWVGSLFLLGTGIASVLAPFLAGRLTAYDPRIMFAASSISVVVVTLSIVWAEKTLAHSAARNEDATDATDAAGAAHAAGGIQPATFVLFLGAVLLVAIGFQVHSFINVGSLVVKFAGPTQLLQSLFWIGFSLLMLPASLLAKRYGGIAVMALGALVAAASAWAVEGATNVLWFGTAQFVCGAAWGCVSMSAVAAALAIGHTGHEGKAVGAMFSLMAVAAMARIVLVAGHYAQLPALAPALAWLPSLAWLGAGLMLLPNSRRRLQPAQYQADSNA